MGDPKPSHVLEKANGGRTKNMTGRSYLMEYPSRRLVEGFRLYSCLIDEIYGLDWETSGGKELPREKQPAARANNAKEIIIMETARGFPIASSWRYPLCGG